MTTILDQVKELRRLADEMEASYRPEVRKARRVFIPRNSIPVYEYNVTDADEIEFLEVLQPAKDARVLWVRDVDCPDEGMYQRADGSLINTCIAHAELPAGDVARYFTRFVEMPE